MKSEKRNIITVGIVGMALLLVLSTYLILSNSTQSADSAETAGLPISYRHGDFLVDTDEPREVVGAADYYFVARIESLDSTEYRNAVTIETQNGYKEVSDPYTNYTITVIHNIKGNLEQATPIQITKAGGVTQDGSSIALYENDMLPEVGYYYVISAFAQQDGSLLISGPNSLELVQNNALTRNAQPIEASYVLYQQYFDEEISVERQRFSSVYEVQP
jgi:hypothetical protein